MSLEKLISKQVRLALGFSIALSAAAKADLPMLYSALAEKGISARQDECTNINGTDITADIYLTNYNNPIKYRFVVIDETLNGSEKKIVESIGGKYIVCSDDASKADSIIRLIGSQVRTVNPVYARKTKNAETYSGTFDLTGRRMDAVSENKIYVNKNGRMNSHFFRR